LLTIRNKSAFLFDENIKMYVDELYVKIKRIKKLHIREEKAQGDEREKILEEATPLLSWFEEEVDRVEERFKPYLHL